MMHPLIPFSMVLPLVTMALAVTILPEARHPLSWIPKLAGRQDSDPFGLGDPRLPEQCQSVCTNLFNLVNGQGCTTSACTCTNPILKSYADCFGCLYSLAPPTADQLRMVQGDLDQIEKGCNTLGFPVASFTITASTVVSTAMSSSSTPSPSFITTVIQVLPSSNPGVGTTTIPPPPIFSPTTPATVRTTIVASPSPSAGGSSNSNSPMASAAAGFYPTMLSVILAGILGGVMIVLNW